MDHLALPLQMKHDDLVRLSPECDSRCFFILYQAFLDGTLIPLTTTRQYQCEQKHSETVSVWSKNTAHQRGEGIEPTPIRHSATSICSNTAWIVFRARELGYLLCQEPMKLLVPREWATPWIMISLCHALTITSLRVSNKKGKSLPETLNIGILTVNITVCFRNNSADNGRGTFVKTF